MSRKYVVLGILVFLSFGLNIYVYFIRDAKVVAQTQEIVINVEMLGENSIVIQKVELSVKKSSVTQEMIKHQVPFTSQAPLGEWWDPRQQYGCEEALSVMAMHWIKGEDISFGEAREEILAIAEFQQEHYGMFEDTSIPDTETRIFRGYYQYAYTKVRTGISVEDIKEELYEGNIILVPINGRTIQNPYYTLPGPLRHMILVIGYDPETRTFITNDPGTKNGANFLYEEDILASSLQNYATGVDESIKDEPPSMLVVYSAEEII